MKKIAFLIGVSVVVSSMVGCSQTYQKPENTLATTSQMISKIAESSPSVETLGDKITSVSKSLSASIPKKVRETTFEIKQQAPKTIYNFKKVSKEAARSMDENFNAIF